MAPPNSIMHSALNQINIEEIKEQGLIEGASKRAGVRGVVDQ